MPTRQQIKPFADFQDKQGTTTAQDIQPVQGTQATQDSQAAGDTHAAQSTQLEPLTSQSATQAQDAGVLDLDDDDDAVMQQVLLESRQQAQPQGSDPTASSSTGGQAMQARTIEDEIQYELKMGRDFQTEASSFEQTMATRHLTPEEVDRLRKVSELININKQRVVELCEARIRENQAQQVQDNSTQLGSLKPLQPSRPKPAVQKSAPKAGVATAMQPPPVIVKHPPGDRRKARPPVLPAPMPPPVKPPPTQQQSGDEQDSGKGPPPSTLPITKFSGSSLATPAFGSSKANSIDKSEGTSATNNCDSFPAFQSIWSSRGSN